LNVHLDTFGEESDDIKEEEGREER